MSQADIKTVVKRVNLVRQRQLRVTAFLFVVIATGVVYYLGYQNGFDDRVPLVLDEAGLKARISKLETRLSVESETLSRLREELAGKERKVGDLERELVFYRDIMSSSEDVSSVKDRDPDISWRPDSRELESCGGSAPCAWDAVLQGQMRVELIDSEGRALDATYSSTPDHTIGFKYFQRISGIIKVPAGFVAAELRFAVKLSKPRKRSYEQRFAWQETPADSV